MQREKSIEMICNCENDQLECTVASMPEGRNVVSESKRKECINVSKQIQTERRDHLVRMMSIITVIAKRLSNWAFTRSGRV